jgi:uncharacterized membrane protein YfcA
MTLLFLAIGLAGGVLSGLFGIGGGIVIVPALLVFARMSPATATGTSLASLLLPVGALGAWAYYREGHLDLRAALLNQGLSPRTATRLFSAFLVVIAVRLWTTAR